MSEYMDYLKDRENDMKLVEVQYGMNMVKEPGCEDYMGSPEKVYSLLKDKLAYSDQEKFLVIHLNGKNVPMSIDVAGIGTAMKCMVDIAHVARAAVMSGCVAVILAHNHPSGVPEMSEDDVKVTKQIQKALKLFDIVVLDHVIIGKYGYQSMKTEGIIK